MIDFEDEPLTESRLQDARAMVLEEAEEVAVRSVIRHALTYHSTKR